MKKLLVLLLLSYTVMQAGAQSPSFQPVYTQEVGIDVSRILTFLERNNQAYSLAYKIHNNVKHKAVRFGLNLDASGKEEEQNYIDARVGYEWQLPENKWQLFYGADASYYYYSNNLQETRSYRYGISPLFGIKYHFSPHFSLSTEAKLNFFYFRDVDKGSFDPESTKSYKQIALGSVGVLYANYHFNWKRKKTGS
jgi:hypothetical protein